jgi:DNA polymerase III subunit beta
MEFICSKNDLSKGVQVVERIVSTRSTLPIIGNILIETMKNTVKVTANNLEIGMEININAKIIKEGSILIPAKTLAGIVSKLPEGEITFKVSDKGVVKIVYGQSHLNIHGLPADEFPNLPKMKEAKSFSIESIKLSTMLEQTVFSVSNSEDKYVLNGVLFETGKNKDSKDDDNIRMVATDGYRLAKRSDKIEGTTGKEVCAIIPAKALNELYRVLDEDDEKEVKIEISNEQASFQYKQIYLISRLIQGQFPDYKQVIPKSSETKITVDAGQLLEACERAAVIAVSAANIIKMEAKAGKLHINASAPDIGNANEVVNADIKGKEKAQAAFNVRLIIEALKVINSEKIVIELSGPLSPGAIKPEKDNNYTYIVMPIRTQETV